MKPALRIEPQLRREPTADDLRTQALADLVSAARSTLHHWDCEHSPRDVDCCCTCLMRDALERLDLLEGGG